MLELDKKERKALAQKNGEKKRKEKKKSNDVKEKFKSCLLYKS